MGCARVGVGGRGLPWPVGSNGFAVEAVAGVIDTAGVEVARGVPATWVRRASTVWRAWVILIVGVIFERDDGLLHPARMSIRMSKNGIGGRLSLVFILVLSRHSFFPGF